MVCRFYQNKKNIKQGVNNNILNKELFIRGLSKVE